MADLWDSSSSVRNSTLPRKDTSREQRTLDGSSMDGSTHLRKRLEKGLNLGASHSAKLATRAKSLFMHTKSKASVSSLPEEEHRQESSPTEDASLYSDSSHSYKRELSSGSKFSPKLFRNKMSSTQNAFHVGKQWREKLGLKRSRASSETDMQLPQSAGSSSSILRVRNRSPTRINRQLSHISGGIASEPLRLGISDAMIRSYMSSTVSICESAVFMAGEELQPRTGLENVFANIFDVLERRGQNGASEKMCLAEADQYTIPRRDFEKWMLPNKRSKDSQQNKTSPNSQGGKCMGSPTSSSSASMFHFPEWTGMERESHALLDAFKRYDVDSCLELLDGVVEDSEEIDASSSPIELRHSTELENNDTRLKGRSSMRLSVVEQLGRLEEQFHRTNSLRGSKRTEMSKKTLGDFSRKGSLKKEESLFGFLNQSLMSLNSSFKKKPLFAPLAVAEKSQESLYHSKMFHHAWDRETRDPNHDIHAQTTLTEWSPTTTPHPPTSSTSNTPSTKPHPPNESCDLNGEVALDTGPYSPIIDPRNETKSSTLPRKMQSKVPLKDILPDKHNLCTYSPTSMHLLKPARQSEEVFFQVHHISPMHSRQDCGAMLDYCAYEENPVPVISAADVPAYSTNTVGRHRPLRSNFRLDYCGPYVPSTCNQLAPKRHMNSLRLEQQNA